MLSTRHFIPACLLMAVLTVACDKSSNQPTVKMSLPVNAAAKRYAITADVVVQDDNAWLENIVVSGKAAGQPK